MRGDDILRKLRRSGVRPGLAFVDLVAEHTTVPNDWTEWAAQAHVEVHDSEPIRRLDLRFLVGLHVIASGFDADRVEQLHEACKAAGAARVVSILHCWHGEEVRTVSTRDSLAESAEA